MVKKVWQQPKSFLMLIPWLALAWLLAACTSSSPQSGEALIEPTATPTTEPRGRAAGDTLRLLYWEAPDTLNPHLSGSDRDLDVGRLVYEPLASFDKNDQLIPILAVEIPSAENGGVAPDGKSVTWKLKQEVKWSDGQPFTADDVLFTYEFITNPKSKSGAYYSAVANVEVIDDYTVKVNFKEPNPVWAQPFVGPRGVIIPRHIFEKYNGPNAQESAKLTPVGTGPYKLDQIKREEVLFLGDRLVPTIKLIYIPNLYFREADKPYFSRVELKGGGTVNEAARSVLKAGEVDFAYNLQEVDPDTLEKLQQAGKGHIVTTFGARVAQIELNQTDPNRKTPDGEFSSVDISHPFFSDKKVRQAIAYAIDREAIVKLYGSTARPTYNNLVAPADYASPNTFYQYDPAKARVLLEEAGWVDTNGDGIREKDGRPLTLVAQAQISSLIEQTQKIVQQNLKNVGISLEVNLLDSGTLFGDPVTNPQSVFRFPADLQEYDVSTSSPDPGPYMQFWTCKQIPQKKNNWSGINIGRWCNQAYDDLLTQATRELYPEKRRQLFIQMNDLQVEDVAMIPLAQVAQISGVSGTITGLEPTPWDSSLWDIKDWRRNILP